MAAELRPLLRAVREAQPFGPAGYGRMSSDGHDRVFRQMEDVQTGFEADMQGRLEAGFPDFPDKLRTGMLGGISLLSVAYSAGLSNGELPVPALSSMAALTAITGVANRLIDYGDPFMRSATLRWCGTHPDSESVLSGKEQTRLQFMRGLDEITETIVSRKDHRPVLSVLNQLMAANVAAHDLTMKWKNAGDEAAFWGEHTDDVARTLLVTGALPSATIPLVGMYHLHDPNIPGAKEVWSDPHVRKQCRAANAIIRVDDDFGDRQRDASSERMSINLFNIASSPHGKRVIGRFCVAAGIENTRTISRITDTFHDAISGDEVDAVRMITNEFERNFWEANDNVPKVFAVHEKLVLRALAAGRTNTMGDDAL